MNSLISISILFLLAVILEIIIGWAGSVLYSVASSANKTYAVFTFREDRSKSMSTNVLMNICIPNVAMIFLFMVANHYKLIYIQKFLILFVVFYYFYRWLLICIIKRRKELYRYSYEIIMAICGCLLSYLIKKYFLTDSQNIFIAADELKSELWLAIIFVLYKFFIQIIDKIATQKNIVTDNMILRYIINKFNIFFKKFEHLIDLNIENRYVWILIFSIMIFEDYNRGPIIRKIERIKFHFSKKATLGIMQFPTTELIDDEMSISLAYDFFMNESKDNRQFADDYMYVKDLAWKYNNDTDYSKSVAYIYNCLIDYLDKIPRYRKYFMLREKVESISEISNNTVDDSNYNNSPAVKIACMVQNPSIINISSSSDFIRTIANNTTIIWKKGEYNVLDYDILDLDVHESNIYEEEVSDGSELIVESITNLQLIGNSSKLIVSPHNAHVLTFRNCHDITIKNFSMGHKPANSYCEEAVLKFDNCTNIFLNELDLYGCGTYGLELESSSNIYINKLKIYNCSCGAIHAKNSSYIIEDFEIYNCNKTSGSLIELYNSNVIFHNGCIHDNKELSSVFNCDDSVFSCHDITVKNNSYYKLSNTQIPNIILKNNIEIENGIDSDI